MRMISHFVNATAKKAKMASLLGSTYFSECKGNFLEKVLHVGKCAIFTRMLRKSPVCCVCHI